MLKVEVVTTHFVDILLLKLILSLGNGMIIPLIRAIDIFVLEREEEKKVQRALNVV